MVEQSGLFCILVDNTVKTTEYTDLPVSVKPVSSLPKMYQCFHDNFDVCVLNDAGF